MGGIVFWALVRIAILIPAIWLIVDRYYIIYWKIWAILIIYVVVIHPVYLQYKKFTIANKEIMEDTICATCVHFDESAILCMKHDKHPTHDFIPCNGYHWEIKQ